MISEEAPQPETTDAATVLASVENKPIAIAPKISKVAPDLAAKTSITEAAAGLSKKELKKEIKKVAKEKRQSSSGKSQLVALLLAIFVGVIGIHRFYLGYVGIGIAQILTLGGCGIWSLIDLIRIAIGDLKPKDGDYTEKL
ncbi:TM2 domain-containing protein [Pontibacter qinzhouensis]|uniref:TM2 domain-containing protein n=1 Tax=Pontibacter qinzhouensis TaxID=2603253 RepID=A0A5C8KD76_9BACT|nr:TM2 domain-containing protein [Pontibacter qinzhouensis]TXK52884.1 TM2 domain-containing protein [Pontibacter qinzhouensis]